MTRLQRMWTTGTFWLDTFERTVRTFIVVVLSILGATTDWPQDWSSEVWRGIVYATVGTFLMCLLAAFVGEPGTASTLNPAPPDTLNEEPVKDGGQVNIEFVLVVAAMIVLGLVIYHLAFHG